MSGDHTKFSFDPAKRYSGVLMQQGRVQLDSDWNEDVEILKRRVRTTTVDILGAVGVPFVVSPEAFLIGLVAGPPADLSIGAGRIYVDGVQIEAFAEENATYLSQPFLPDPPPLPAGNAVAWLDVWEREVTYVQDPELLDAALGGADTTTRTQTVWQLRVEGRDQADCGVDVGEPPSAGRLTTAAIAPPAPDDPCILPPASGYRGLENRLYRVEVHTPGPLGTAAFKWSRDNGSIVSAVRSMAASGTDTTLVVSRIGRDQFMRFLIGDWVTVTDDHRELMGEPGEMARVVDLDEANLRVVLDRVLPTGGGRPFGPTDADLAARHTRVQKWNQNAAANPGLDPLSGLIDTAAGPIALESGIELSFSADPVGGSFRVGDYWAFWARTATAEIEALNVAPPRGIEHRHVQVAAVSGLGGPAPAVEDCRPPPSDPSDADCCCTIVVPVGGDIQAGIDALPLQGGCVCLKAGLHIVRQPLQITRGAVTLTGESPGTRVRNAGAGPVLIVGSPRGARIEGMEVLGIDFEANAPRAAAEGVVTVFGCARVRIEHCGMRATESVDFVGVTVLASDRVTVAQCRIERLLVGIWVRTRCEDFVADANLIELGGANDRTLALAGVLIQQSAFPCRITRNLVAGALLGVVLNDTPFGTAPASLAARSIVAENLIELADFDVDDTTTLRLPGVDCAADDCTISDNTLRYRGSLNVGVRVTGSGCAVTGNHLGALGTSDDFRGPVAVQIGMAGDDDRGPVLGGVVAHNIARGRQHGVLIDGADDLLVSDNVLQPGDGTGLFGLFGLRVGGSRFAGNRIRGALSGVFLADGRQNRVAENAVRDGVSGVTLLREWGPAVTGNRIDNLTQWGVAGAQLSGRCDIVGNRVNACGRAMNPIARAISLFAVAGEAHIVGNEVVDTGSVGAAQPTTAADHGIVGDLILEARVAENLVTYSNASGRDVQREDRALIMRGLFDIVVNDNLTMGFAIQIGGNKFVGTGRTALVELLQTPLANGFARFERVTFENNYCMHVTTTPDDARATVSLTGRAAIVANNHVKATTRGYFSFDFNGIPGPCIGNVVAGPTLQHPDFPAPFNAFNILQF